MQENYIPTFCVKFLNLFFCFVSCRDQKGSQDCGLYKQ